MLALASDSPEKSGENQNHDVTVSAGRVTRNCFSGVILDIL